MKKIATALPKLIVTGSLMLTIGIASAQTKMKAKSSRPAHMNMNMATITDTGFVRKNVMDNMMEIRLSEIGRDQANNKAVRQLAAQMVTDHTQILADLTTIAGRMSVPDPDTTTMALPAPGADNSLGKTFDRTWVNQMLVMHGAKVKELQVAIPKLKDPILKASALSALPKIRLHAEMLTKLAAVAKRTGK